MDIKQLKKEFGLKNKEIAEFFNMKPIVYANSSAKKRYERALCSFYERINKIKIMKGKIFKPTNLLSENAKLKIEIVELKKTIKMHETKQLNILGVSIS